MRRRASAPSAIADHDHRSASATPGACIRCSRRFIDAEAFQCGYCTPGMVMAVVGLLQSTPNPSDADIARLLDRNVCRCGTYPRIVKAIHRRREPMRARAGAGDERALTSTSSPSATS